MYLIRASIEPTITVYYSQNPNGTRNSIDKGNHIALAKFATQIWAENIQSVNYLYDTDTDCNEYIITPQDLAKYLRLYIPIKPIQVVKACHALAYQSCEHPAWEKSEANYFLECLSNTYIRKIPGYDEAEWGAPIPPASCLDAYNQAHITCQN